MTADSTADLRRSLYLLMMTITIGVVSGRILSAQRIWEPSLHRMTAAQTAGVVVAPLAAIGPLDLTPLAVASERLSAGIRPPGASRPWSSERPTPTPMFGSNDRSRWATIRALVDHGTMSVGRRVSDPNSPKGYRDEGIIFEDSWTTIDVVKDPATDLFYSSKPPLMQVVLAGEYWLIRSLTGWTLAERPFEVVRVILLTINVLPLAVFLCVLAGLLERSEANDFTRLFVFASAAFGTFLTTFAVTLNNHTPAACCALFAVAPLLRAPVGRWSLPQPSAGAVLVCGFFAGLTACLELPAASLTAGLFAVCFLAHPGRAIGAFLPAALLPVAALVGTNYLAIGEWVPAYSKFGGPWYDYPGSHWTKAVPGIVRSGIDYADEPKTVYAFHVLFGHHGWFSLTPVWLLAVGGMIAGTVSRGRGWWLAGLTMAVSLVVTVFYLVKTNNYGGGTSGLRWLFWLTPLWLLALLPAVDWLGRSRFGRTVACVLLGLSALSASYPAFNPWRQPWLYRWMETQGWIAY